VTDAVKDLVLIQVGPSDRSGGIAHVMSAIDEWMRTEGVSTTTISTSCDGPLPKRIVFGVAGLLRAAWTMFRTPGALIHIHTASYGSFLRKAFALLAARASGKPVLLHVHGGGFSCFIDRGPAWRKACIAALLGQADAICVVNTRTMLAIARLQPQARVSVIPNPVTLVCGRLTDPEPRRVLFLGRLGTTKGTDVLLEAIRLLQDADIAAGYVLAGDGDVEATRAAVKTLPTPSAVSVPGWVNADDVHRLLHESSVFCLPSRFEGLPMALLQAMGHGLACVVTPVGGMNEVVANGVNGLVVPEGDPEAVATALGALLEDVGLRARLGRKASRDILQSYAPETVMHRLEGIYCELLSEGGPRADA